MAHKEYPIEGTDLICLDLTDDDWRPIVKVPPLTESERKRYNELIDSVSVAAALKLLEASLILKKAEQRQADIHYFWSKNATGQELSGILRVLWWLEGYEFVGLSVHGRPIVRKRS